MDAIQCVISILESLENIECEVNYREKDRVVFLAKSYAKSRICMIVTDGIAHTRLVAMLSADPLGPETIARVSRHVDEVSKDVDFIGRFESVGEELHWRIDFTLCSIYEANAEMLDAVLCYARNDLARLDLILGLEASGIAVEEMRERIAQVGLVSGCA